MQRGTEPIPIVGVHPGASYQAACPACRQPLRPTLFFTRCLPCYHAVPSSGSSFRVAQRPPRFLPGRHHDGGTVLVWRSRCEFLPQRHGPRGGSCLGATGRVSDPGRFTFSWTGFIHQRHRPLAARTSFLPERHRPRCLRPARSSCLSTTRPGAGNLVLASAPSPLDSCHECGGEVALPMRDSCLSATKRAHSGPRYYFRGGISDRVVVHVALRQERSPFPRDPWRPGKNEVRSEPLGSQVAPRAVLVRQEAVTVRQAARVTRASSGALRARTGGSKARTRIRSA